MTITRREAARLLTGAFLISCACCSAARAQFPGTDSDDVASDDAAESDPSSDLAMEGCTLTDTGVSLFGSGADAGGPALYRSSGNPFWDQAFGREVEGSTKPIFGLSPDFCYYDDSGGPNAFATSAQLIGAGQGTVAFGMQLFNSLLGKFAGSSMYSMGDHAAVAVIAHEFGHIAQFAFGLPQVAVHLRELHADFLSGWYMAVRAQQLQGWQVVNVQEAAREMFDIGSFDFTNPGFHGTPQQRLTAFVGGLQSGGQSLQGAFMQGRTYVGF